MSRTLLITGMGRSGTSLMQKLLNTHASICVGPQPFPDLFLGAKTAFLAARGVTRPNPIGTRFPGADGTIDELAAFLETDRWPADRLDDLFQAMATNSGQYLPALARVRDSIRPGTFWDVYRQLLAEMADQLGGGPATWVGSKETWFEELATVLVARGGSSVFVVRDPRDMLTSFRYGRGRQHTGSVRPTLFLLRQWRKSVAFSLYHRLHPLVATVRFEDLVADPHEALAPVAEMLGVDPFSPAAFDPLDEAGGSWRGNSSFNEFDGVSREPVGRWKAHLDPATVAYVDAVCGPELDRLGYARVAMSEQAERDAIMSFAEPIPVDHPRFEPGYSSSSVATGVECQRLDLLRNNADRADLGEWFVFPEVHELLRR